MSTSFETKTSLMNLHCGKYLSNLKDNVANYV